MKDDYIDREMRKALDGYIPLGARGLSKVWNWCERNERHPTSMAYMEACCFIGAFNESHQHLRKWETILNFGFVTRDMVGREVLKLMKIYPDRAPQETLHQPPRLMLPSIVFKHSPTTVPFENIADEITAGRGLY